jgi:hypothetical protein
VCANRSSLQLSIAVDQRRGKHPTLEENVLQSSTEKVQRTIARVTP